MVYRSALWQIYGNLVFQHIELYRIIQFHNVLTNTIYKLYANYGRQIYYVKIWEKILVCISTPTLVRMMTIKKPFETTFFLTPCILFNTSVLHQQRCIPWTVWNQNI